MVGEAEKITETVAPIQTARLKTLHVHIGDHVKAGQLIAEMDDSLPDAQFAATGAAVTEAELGLENNNQGGILTLIRSTEAATNDAIIVLNEQRLTQKRDEAELAQLKAIQKERDELFAMRLISAVEEDALKPQIAAIERSVAALPEIISAMEQHLAETAKQEKGLRRNLRIGENQDASLTVDQQISAHTDVLKSDLKVRQVQKDFYRLYATREGVVSQIDVYPGNIVQAGGRIVELVAEKPTRIIGYLPELRFNSVNPGNKGYAFHQWGIIGTGTGKPMKVTVQAIAPEIETLPPNVGANTSMQTMRIRRIIFTIDEENSFVAGETIQIRMTMPFSVLVRNVFGL
jgi:multidrug resistance efflux pump